MGGLGIAPPMSLLQWRPFFPFSDEPLHPTPCEEMRIVVGVPAVAQRVKNPTAAALVAAEVQVQSPAPRSGLKDPASPQLWLGMHSVPGLGASICCGCGQKK